MHHHLVSGKVIFTDPQNDDAIGTVELPHVMRTPSRNITVNDIDVAQKSLVVTMYAKLNGTHFVPHDCVIYSISYLGHMLESEFNKKVPKADEPKALDPMAG